jgi:hypothetical protein
MFETSFLLNGVSFLKEGFVTVGHFYYIKDQYYLDFPDPKLMRNKERVNGVAHDRPCFFAFEETTSGILWLVPISSQISKYKAFYEEKVKKYHKCDTLAFGEVLGYEKAFLIQNMCPITQKYLKNEYVDNKDHIPVRVGKKLEQEIINKARKVLALERKGVNLIFPDVLAIEKKLIVKKRSLVVTRKHDPNLDLDKGR